MTGGRVFGVGVLSQESIDYFAGPRMRLLVLGAPVS